MGPLVQNLGFPLAGNKSHQQAESGFRVKVKGEGRCLVLGLSVLGPCRVGQPPVLTHIKEGEEQMFQSTPYVEPSSAHFNVSLMFLLIF